VCPNSYGRDDFHLAKALYLRNQLECLISERPSFLYANRIKDCVEITSKYSVSINALLLDARRRLRLKTNNTVARLIDWLYVSQSVGKKGNEIAKARSLKIVSELYSAYSAFSGLERANCVLFQTHPQASYLKKLYQELMIDGKSYSTDINEYHFDYELEMWSRETFDMLDKPVGMASKIICASEYVKNSILENYPMLDSIIKVVPYGVDFSEYPSKKNNPSCNKMKFLYVGQRTARKGFFNLIDAWKRGIKNSELHIVGFDVPENIKNNFLNNDIFIHGRISHKALVNAFHDADCFIFPSISEGFGLVLLQSISCGTPIIASCNSAGPDIINSHEVGMTINPFSVDHIYRSMVFASENRDIVSAWSENCLKARGYYSWGRFHDGVANYLN